MADPSEYGDVLGGFEAKKLQRSKTKKQKVGLMREPTCKADCRWSPTPTVPVELFRTNLKSPERHIPFSAVFAGGNLCDFLTSFRVLFEVVFLIAMSSPLRRTDSFPVGISQMKAEENRRRAWMDGCEKNESFLQKIGESFGIRPKADCGGLDSLSMFILPALL